MQRLQCLAQRPAQQQAEGNDDGARQQRNAPPPTIERGGIQYAGEADADQPGHHHGKIRAGRLQRDVKPAAQGRGRLHQERRARAHLAAEREALDEPEANSKDGRGDADGRVGRYQRQAGNADADQGE